MSAKSPRARGGKDQGIVDFFHELGQLKRVQRSGWWLCGVKQAESVAEHVFRTAAIAYVLAALDGADAQRAAAIAVFHDLAETRVNDAHRLARRYVPDWRSAEVAANEAQLARLPGTVQEVLARILAEGRQAQSRESRLARDADRLECLLQAREYAEQGIATDEWVRSSVRELKTPAARRLARVILRTTPSRWRSSTSPPSKKKSPGRRLASKRSRGTASR